MVMLFNNKVNIYIMDTTNLTMEMVKEIKDLKEEIKNLRMQTLYPRIVIFKHEVVVNANSDYFELPPVVVAGATEVLLFISKRTGFCKGCDKEYEVMVSTRYQGNDVSKAKFIYFEYEQNAWSYNSDNVWLTVTPERRVYIKGGSVAISIMGYKC